MNIKRCVFCTFVALFSDFSLFQENIKIQISHCLSNASDIYTAVRHTKKLTYENGHYQFSQIHFRLEEFNLIVH